LFPLEATNRAIMYRLRGKMQAVTFRDLRFSRTCDILFVNGGEIYEDWRLG